MVQTYKLEEIPPDKGNQSMKVIMPTIEVYEIAIDFDMNNKLILPVNDAELGILNEIKSMSVGDTLVIYKTRMSKKDYDNLPEHQGW